MGGPCGPPKQAGPEPSSGIRTRSHASDPLGSGPPSAQRYCGRRIWDHGYLAKEHSKRSTRGALKESARGGLVIVGTLSRFSVPNLFGGLHDAVRHRRGRYTPASERGCLRLWRPEANACPRFGRLVEQSGAAIVPGDPCC
ncbi:hypothetical protein FRC08_011473 [Ceratobasidium sp. 394]|nr:hypothetical protein FRC08_011473 [Ceratobasidium sp. 394]